MGPIPNETWRSCIRCRHRRRALLMFSSMGEMYLGQAARMLGIQPHRVRALLYGDGKAYSHELALVTLGLVREKQTGRGRAWEITALGRRKARSLAAAEARKASAASWRKIAEKAERELAAIAAKKGDTADAPAGTCGFTWSVDVGTGAASGG